MSACANCYQYIPEHQGVDGVDCIEEGYFDVGYWWNWNTEHEKVYVCSQECRDELKQRVENGNWMLWRHLADLPQPSLHSSLALPDDY
tara:strand:- start:103 stop:366 length:264 start_codon:yes stop_codon:yes gene_type:complete